MTQTSFLEPDTPAAVLWEPKKSAAIARLQHFLPRAGGAYARTRNYDFGPDNRSNVSALSPWLRHRFLLEEDILRATLAQHSFSAAEKFIQEVFWRGYFKGWLEHHPEVWRRYRAAVRDQVGRLETDASLARRYDAAVSGKTGIDCFDTWTKELLEFGYLHNHARMWFASIWIFTLRLPWELGADFFYRHLLDGDPASNTCSWRWVCGLHTKGKTYLARASNIERYTEGRFCSEVRLVTEALPLEETELPAPMTPKSDPPGPVSGVRHGLLITEEDCSPETLLLGSPPNSILVLSATTQRSLLPVGKKVNEFAPEAMSDTAQRAAQHFSCEVISCDAADWRVAIADWARANALDAITTAQLPLGPVSRRVRRAMAPETIPLIEIARRYDTAVWPHARRGFFGLKKKLPTILTELELVG